MDKRMNARMKGWKGVRMKALKNGLKDGYLTFNQKFYTSYKTLVRTYLGDKGCNEKPYTKKIQKIKSNENEVRRRGKKKSM